MKNTTQIDIPATVKTVETHITCDLCGETIKPEGRFEVREVEVSSRTGMSYGGDGGDTVTDEIDCCLACFDSKVKPAIESLGAAFRQTRNDW